jgi:hypothetical protein
MAHHYLWGSKALNIANNTIYAQYSGGFKHASLKVEMNK